MSKKLKNYTNPMELMDKYGSDSFRFLLLSSPVVGGEDFSLKDKDVLDVSRKLSMVWNMYDFFTLYAEVDKWEYKPGSYDITKDASNTLDKWVIARLHQTANEVDKHMKNYDLPNAVKPILPFIDDASNWFVRRSRKRFWKGENDKDKDDAYKTLHYVLSTLSRVMAPFTPFMSEEIYRKLTGQESVHLTDWPTNLKVDEAEIEQMDQVRNIITQGLAERAEANIKVRQPLASAKATHTGVIGGKNQQDIEDILKEELNVKAVELVHGKEVDCKLDLKLTKELVAEGMAREVVRQIQNSRKKAGFNIEDRVKLQLVTKDKDLSNAIDIYKEYIHSETLSAPADVKDPVFEQPVKIGDVELTILLTK
jgi:isoleucyl-tRNA synthetase